VIYQCLVPEVIMQNRMNSRVLSILAGVSGLVALVCGVEAMAETVYRWTDSAGITHFSQEPPPENMEVVEMVEIDALIPPPRGANNYFSVVNQARRMEADRRKREQENLERRLAIKRAQQGDQEDPESYRSDTNYIPVYTFYGYRRPHRSGYYRGKPGYGHYRGYRPGIGKHPRREHYRSTQGRHYPRGVVNIGR